jgi:hypothetical protein
MSWSPDVAFVNNYRNQLTPIFQQKGSRLRSTVRVVTQNAEFDYFDRLGEATANAITTRHADTPLDDIEHTRRRNQIQGYNNALLFDNQDKLKMLIDPTQGYAQAQAWALGRKMDDVIIAAASGTAYTGKTGSGTQAFDADQRVAVNYVESGAAADSGLTIAKLRRTRKILEANEVLDSGEMPVFVLTSTQMQDLLRTTEVTNADYNSVKALVQGSVDTFMGFRFLRTERLATSSGDRVCLAYVPSAILLGVAEDVKVRINERDDKNYSIQVYSEATFGATRMWEEAIVEVLCNE